MLQMFHSLNMCHADGYNSPGLVGASFNEECRRRIWSLVFSTRVRYSHMISSFKFMLIVIVRATYISCESWLAMLDWSLFYAYSIACPRAVPSNVLVLASWTVLSLFSLSNQPSPVSSATVLVAWTCTRYLYSSTRLWAIESLCTVGNCLYQYLRLRYQ
jgi:hypothetical protein